MNVKALINFVVISEVKDMKSNVFMGIWKNSKQKRTLKFHFELKFNNFQEKKDGKVLG